MAIKREKAHIDIVHTTHYGSILYVNSIKQPDFEFSESEWVELINGYLVESANEFHIVTEYEETMESIDDLPTELGKLIDYVC